MDRDEFPNDVFGYHRRTRHAPQRYALGPAFLDWDSQPNGFRRFEGARLVPLPLGWEMPTPPFGQWAGTAAGALDLAGLGLFLELAFGLSAWKEAEGSRWPLRNNPSSGNLHPTESWVVLPALDGLSEAPGLYHYAPCEHGLEERRRLDALPMAVPAGGFLLALSSVPWREAWKYGERSFRYCQHDVGHALAGAAYAAACLGWGVRVLVQPGDDALAALLGLDRDDGAHPREAEHPDLIALVAPLAAPDWPGEAALLPVEGQWFGRANRLSDDPDPWPLVDRVLRFTRRGEGEGARALAPLSAAMAPLLPPPSAGEAAAVIRRRRSAQRMKKGAGIDRATFLRLLAATLPNADPVPWQAFPWTPRLALMVLVHQVEGVEPGLYALIRDPAQLADLQAGCDPAFAWSPLPDCPLPLYLLEARALRTEASSLSCLQAIAGHGAFCVCMLADFRRTLVEDGAWAYRRLHWEAGMIGQALYLEATAAGRSGTGIGCFFDEPVLDLCGIDGTELAWQALYNFTVGEAMEDGRISTHPPYLRA